jgi:hypothetical protein
MKLCKDCRWISGVGNWAVCDHPKAQYKEASPVTGRVVWHRLGCETFRMSGALPFCLCGPDGKLWEPADSSPVGFA